MYLAGYLVVGFLVAGVYAPRAGWRASATATTATALIIPLTFAALAAPVQLHRRRLGGAHGGRGAAGEAGGLRGAGRRPTKGAPFHIGGNYEDGELKTASRSPTLLSILAYHDPNATVKGLDIRAARTTSRRSNVVRSRFLTMVTIGTALGAARRCASWSRGGGGDGCPRRSGSTAAVVRPGRWRSWR